MEVVSIGEINIGMPTTPDKKIFSRVGSWLLHPGLLEYEKSICNTVGGDEQICSRHAYHNTKR